MEFPKFIHKSAFTNSSIFGYDIKKWLIKVLAEVGITTTDTCCGQDTIDSKITALRTQSGTFTEYRALLTQSSITAPTSTVINNTLGSITIGYTSTGIYTFTLTGAFTSGKTYFSITNNTASANHYTLVRTSANVITLTVTNGAGVADALLTDTPFLIQVYS